MNVGGIRNCYAAGEITTDTGSVGGFCWSEVFSQATAMCYSTVTVNAANGNTGGFCYVAGDDSLRGFLLGCFWDQSLNPGLYDIYELRTMPDFEIVSTLYDSPDIMGVSTAEMQTQSTFEAEDWDFERVWAMGANGYPEIVGGPGPIAGNGSEEEPFLISWPEHLDEISKDDIYWGQHIKMTCDIDMAGYFYSGLIS